MLVLTEFLAKLLVCVCATRIMIHIWRIVARVRRAKAFNTELADLRNFAMYVYSLLQAPRVHYQYRTCTQSPHPQICTRGAHI